MKTKRGRPPLPDGERKGYMLRIRMAKEERALLDEAAGKQGQEMSTWSRTVLVAKAKKVLAE
jgi:uncharacterized protein (DUF1778 family)